MVYKKKEMMIGLRKILRWLCKSARKSQWDDTEIDITEVTQFARKLQWDDTEKDTTEVWVISAKLFHWAVCILQLLLSHQYV